MKKQLLRKFKSTWLTWIYIDLIEQRTGFDSNLYSGHGIQMNLSGTDNSEHLKCQSSRCLFESSEKSIVLIQASRPLIKSNIKQWVDL